MSFAKVIIVDQYKYKVIRNRIEQKRDVDEMIRFHDMIKRHEKRNKLNE